MQKYGKVFHIFNILAIGFILLFSGVALTFQNTPIVKKVQADYAVIDGVDYKLGKLNRFYQGISDEDEFIYPSASASSEDFLSYKDINGKFEDPSFTMLYNDQAKINAHNSVVGNAQNIYFSFGKSQADIISSELQTLTFLISLNVSIKLNDTTNIYVNERIEDTDLIPGTGGGNNVYFEQYFDLTNMYTIDGTGNKGERITNPSGYYTIEVNYVVKKVTRTLVNNVWSYGIHQVLDNATMKYALYIIDESDYKTYPEFSSNTITQGNLSNDGQIQYFYNYDKLNYPTYNYDASKFNVEFVRVKDKTTNAYTSTFTLSPDTSYGTVRFTNKSNATDYYEKVIEKVGNTYPVNLSFTDQGVYTVTNRYIVNVNNTYVICDNIVAQSDLYEDTTEEIGITRSQYLLHIFGFTANYNKSGVKNELLMLNSGELNADGSAITNNTVLINNNQEKTIHSDVTYLFTKSELQSDYSKLYSQLENKLNTYYGSYDFNNFIVASTDQPPVSFTYLGEYKYEQVTSLSNYYKYANVSSTTSTNYYLRKDAYIEDAGYYEVIINYTYEPYNVNSDVGTSVIHTQAFIFKINNTSPIVQIQNVDGTSVNEYGYTNQSVRFVVNPNSSTSLNDNYFNAPISIQMTRENFASVTSSPFNYTQGTILSENSKYYATISYGLNGVSKDTYEFVIDKDPISGILPQAVDAVKTVGSDTISYYQFVNSTNLNEYYNDSVLFNQPFTLLFNEKDSGANIDVTYKRIYFTKNSSAGSIVNGSGDTFVTTNYELNLDSTPQTSEYYYNFDLTELERASVDSVFDLDSSCLILFSLVDQAGNKATYYIIYDLTTPYVHVDPIIENTYNIVSTDATVTWGDYKAIKIIGDINGNIKNSTELFTDYINLSSSIFQDIYQSGTENSVTNNYFTIPVNQIYLNYIDSSDNVVKNYYVKDYDPNDSSKYDLNVIDSVSNDYNIYDFIPSISLVVEGATTNFANGVYVGENNIKYNVSDKSNITSLNSSIKNDTSFSSNIWLNLDKSLGLAFATVTDTTTAYGQLLNEKTPINGNQLRFSYLPGTDNYTVGSVSYDYYEIDAQSYTTYTSVTYDVNEPTPYFPYKVTPTLSDQTISVDTSISKSDDSERVFSEIINQDSVNGNIVTKTGLYVFKRVYTEDTETDKIRYYVFYIDRTKIIDIDAELLNDDRITYEQGYGYEFNFSNDGTKFTALQVQQYIASILSSNTALFSSNKLPITFEMPYDKYNTRQLLNNADTAPAYQNSTYYNKVRTYNESLFLISTEISIISSEGTKTIYTSDSFLTSDIFTAVCSNPGTYTITITDKSGYAKSTTSGTTNNYNSNKYTFLFEITHSAPQASYHTVDLNLSVNNKDSANNNINYQEYVSTNSKILQLSFEKNTDPYKATINAKNFVVYRNNDVVYRLTDNKAYLNGSLIYTITDDVPMHNGALETTYSSVINQNGNTFRVVNEDNVITGYLNDTKVYEFSDGLYKVPGTNDLETVYSPVFGSTLATFTIQNDTATYTNDVTDVTTTIFTLQDRIPINPQGQIATTYSQIFVYNATLNKYVLTLYNAEDTTKTYITNYLTEATYRIVLQYEGISSDYSYSYYESGRNVSVNYFTKTFSINVDRTAPSYNLNQLISMDKFYTNKADIDKEEYFFAVNENFVFVKQNELETSNLFYKYLGPEGVIQSQYLYTITPDNQYYNTSDLSNHDRFVETLTDAYGIRIYQNMEYGRISLPESGYYEIIERDEAGNYTVYAIYYHTGISPEINFTYEQAANNGIISEDNENLTDTTNTYSIKGVILDSESSPISGVTVQVQNSTKSVVTDENGEFVLTGLIGIKTLEFVSTVYSFLPATKRVNELNYNYDETFDPEILATRLLNITAYERLTGKLNLTNSTLLAEGQNLIFDLDDISHDYYLKAIIIGSNGSTQTIINQPDLNNIPNPLIEGEDAWSTFITNINAAMKNFSTTNNYGFTFTIQFVNRFNENYTLTYVLPGIMLQPIIIETKPNAEFTFQLPLDTSSTTYITQLEVKKFSGTNGVGEWVRIARDSKNTTIRTYNDESPLDTSVIYYFTEGEYMFVLTDNFNRQSTHYKGVGVNDVRSISYNNSQVISGTTYTANSVTLSYQTALYRLQVYEIFSNGTKVDITGSLSVNNITEVSNINNVRTLEFQNNEIEGQVINEVTIDGIRQFEVNLTVAKLGLTYPYKFVINKTLPNITLKNLGGEKLKSTSNSPASPTIHTEDFIISWDSTNPLLFNPTVKLTRTYLQNNSELTEVINSISNGYRITNPGTYKAEITNSLGYTNANKTIYFKRIDGNIIMYSIIKTKNSIETELTVSSNMPNIYINSPTGEAEPLYKYYALKYETTLNGVVTTTYDTIEIRVNPSKGLTYKLITEDDSLYFNDGNLIKSTDKVYRIYGSEDDDGTISYGYNRYIQIVYVLSNSDFVKATIQTDDKTYVDTSNYMQALLRTNITTVKPNITISFPEFNLDKGNPIYLEYYFNDIYVETIYNSKSAINSLTLTNAGVYKFKFYDLAGNVQYYTINNISTDTFVINLVNNILFTINNKTPIENEVFNDTIVLDLINMSLYDNNGKDIVVKATKDGVDYKLTNTNNTYYSYIFEDQGYYTVTMTAHVSTDSLQQYSITTNYSFVILNSNQALRSFNIPLNPNFTITNVLRENVNITDNFANAHELWLSAGDDLSGTGLYTVTVNAYISATKSYRDYTFRVWINDEVPVIVSSLDFGKSSTKQIDISFNKNLIYQQVGDSVIRITGMEDIVINAETSTENIRETITLVNNTTYTIQILTADGKVISSYKLIKNEPLNTISIIIIVIVSIVVVGLIITFVVLRRHIKYR